MQNHLSWKGLKNDAVDGRMALQSFFCTEDWRLTGGGEPEEGKYLTLRRLNTAGLFYGLFVTRRIFCLGHCVVEEGLLNNLASQQKSCDCTGGRVFSQHKS
ncbi:hypothetical protein EK904_015076 [Melospiza melodia maxima]|nr:hypothetical protein EK904_015076 [Melospiza melodia maxima]